MTTFDWIVAAILGIGGVILILAIGKAMLSPFLSKSIATQLKLAAKEKELRLAQEETLIGDARKLKKLFFLSTKRTSLSIAEKAHEFNMKVLTFIVSRAPSARDLPNLNVVEELFYNRFLLFQQLEKAYALKAKISAYNSKVKNNPFEPSGALPDIKDSLETNKRALDKEIDTLLLSLSNLLSSNDATIH